MNSKRTTTAEQEPNLEMEPEKVGGRGRLRVKLSHDASSGGHLFKKKQTLINN